MKKLLFIFIALIYVSCSCTKGNDDNQDTTPPISLSQALQERIDAEVFSMWLCSHRANTHSGIKDGLPENSIAAINRAIALGVDIIEIDVRPTSDGTLVLMHDQTIDRTTSGSGLVGSITYSKLKELMLLDSEGNTTIHTVPTLEEALIACKGKAFLNLDIINKEVAVGDVVDLVYKHDMFDQVMFYVSTNSSYAQDLKGVNSSVILHPLAENSNHISTFRSEGYDAMLIQTRNSDAIGSSLPSQIKESGALNFSNITGSNDKNMLAGSYSGLINMINKRIDIVQTDYFELADEFLKEKGMRF